MDRWVRLAIGAGIVLVGWLFILWQNKFHVSPPLVFVCLGFLAAVALIYNLWRAGSAVAKVDDAEAIASWRRPVGPRIDLEREKKTLLKAIKESEFDHQMGKLSKADADRMVAVYRARAIEIIKALEKDTAGRSVREQIEAEVRARLEVEGKTKKKVDQDVVVAEGKKAKKQQKQADKAKAKSEAAGDGAADGAAAAAAETEAEAEAEAATAAEVATAPATAAAAGSEKTVEKSGGDAMVTQSESTPAKEATS